MTEDRENQGENQSLRIKGTVELDQAINHLESLIQSLKDGKVCIEKGSEFVAFHPAPSIRLKIDAYEKKGKEKVKIELSWYKDSSQEGGLGVNISSQEPAPATEEKDGEKN